MGEIRPGSFRVPLCPNSTSVFVGGGSQSPPFAKNALSGHTVATVILLQGARRSGDLYEQSGTRAGATTRQPCCDAGRVRA